MAAIHHAELQKEALGSGLYGEFVLVIDEHFRNLKNYVLERDRCAAGLYVVNGKKPRSPKSTALDALKPPEEVDDIPSSEEEIAVGVFGPYPRYIPSTALQVRVKALQAALDERKEELRMELNILHFSVCRVCHAEVQGLSDLY